MSVLKKIRENVGLVIVIIALSLFAFIFSSVYKGAGNGRGQTSTIGEVNGSSLEYNALMAKYELAQRNNPNANSTAEQYQLKEQAWQSLVREAYYGREWEHAGIGISDDELMMMFTGRIYHPYVQQSGYFSDSTGRYNPGMVSLVFQRADEIDLYDPQTQDMWKNWKQGLLDLREIISLDRRSNKWQSAIKGSALVADNELKWGYEQSARTADISYLFVPYTTIPDEQLQITDSDRNEYLNSHRETYKRTEDEVRLKYVYFSIAPSRQDSANSREELSKLGEDLLISESPFMFAANSSDDRTIDSSAKPLAQLPPALAAIQGRTDTVVGPVLGATGYQLLRVVAVTEDSVNANVNLRHVLVSIAGPTSADSLAAKAKAEEIKKEIIADPSRFAAIVAEKSDDPNKGNGGELGWVAENAFGDVYAKDIKATSKGNVTITTSPQGGYDVVQVVDRSNKLYSFATITREVKAGSETNDSIFKRASMYHGEVVSGSDMDSILKTYPEARPMTTGNIGPGTYSLMGLTAGRPVVTWAFNNEQGAVSKDLIEAEDAFVIAKIEYKGQRGYGSVDGLKQNMAFEVAVRNWVKAKQIKAKLSAGGADLQAMAASYGVGATTGQARGLRMSSSDVQGLGAEPKVVGRAFGLQPNTLSKPLAGNAGVFVVKLDAAIQEPAPMDDFNKMMQSQTLKSSKTEQAINSLFMGMRELSDVRDLRYQVDF